MGYLFHVKIISLLEKKRIHPDFSDPNINEVDSYQFDPSDLPGFSESDSDDEQGWYFFCEPYFKYAKSKRANRRTDGGYWEITGRDCDAKNTSGQVIGSKHNLVFYRLGGTSKEAKTDWVMHVFYVKDENNPRYKKDFVLCFIEKKSKNKSTVSTPDDGQPSDSLFSDPISHNTENSYTEVESQPSSGYHLISDSGKNITQNSFSEVEPQLLQTTNLVTDPGSLIPESITSVVEPQLLFDRDFVPDQMNHIPEITCPTVGPQLLSSNEFNYYLRSHLLESTYSMIYPQPPAEFDAISGCNWLNHSSVSALQLPINPYKYQGSNSSYSNGISNDCNLGENSFSEWNLNYYKLPIWLLIQEV